MSRIWDVDGIEWEDLPTVSDLLCAADTKILAREVALRYGGKPGGCGRGDSVRGLKRARRKLKKLRKIDPEPSDKIVLLPKHVINRRGAGRSFGYYDVSPCAFTRDGVQRLGEDALVDVYSWELPPAGRGVRERYVGLSRMARRRVGPMRALLLFGCGMRERAELHPGGKGAAQVS